MGNQSNEILAALTEARPDLHLYKYLRNRVGASEDMAGNFAGAAAIFEYVVPAGRELYAERLNFEAVGDGMSPENFAGLTLTVGIVIEARDGSDQVILDYTDAVPIKNTTEFGCLAGTDNNVTKGQGTTDGLNIRWTLGKAGLPTFLKAGEKLVVVLNDNFSTLDQMRAMLQGVLLKREQP